MYILIAFLCDLWYYIFNPGEIMFAIDFFWVTNNKCRGFGWMSRLFTSFTFDTYRRTEMKLFYRRKSLTEMRTATLWWKLPVVDGKTFVDINFVQCGKLFSSAPCAFSHFHTILNLNFSQQQTSTHHPPSSGNENVIQSV